MRKILSVIIILFLIFGLIAQNLQIQPSSIMISVSIVGAVDQPGVYKLEPGSRLSEALQMADHISRENKSLLNEQHPKIGYKEPEETKEYSLRNIELRREGEIRNIDLQKYFILGELANNPQLKDSDVIYVPAANKNLSIFGAVNVSGESELVKGDRIADLIELAQGLSEAARLDSASLVRLDYQTGNISEYQFSPSEILNNKNSRENLELQSGDRIYIRSLPEYESKFNVTVAGNALYPGKYAIIPGTTTLYEILKKCGGANKLGNLHRAYLQRISTRDTTVIHDPDYKRLIDKTSTEMSYEENEYLKFKNRELEGKIAVDFEALWKQGARYPAIMLEDNDYIYIPDKVTTVEVSGSVMYPGLYDWVAGENYKYYINQAGGFTNRAGKHEVRIILAKSGSWLKKDKERVLEMGDKVFVPEKEETNIWELTKETLSVMAQLATVLIAIININTK